ncbi:MAG: OmpA family protein [Treponema sp.]|nr:OmpA family protein [Treponema sp.]
MVRQLKKKTRNPARLPIAAALLILAGGLHANTNAWNEPYWALSAGVASSDILVEGMSFGLVLDPRVTLSPSFMLGSKNIINFSSDNIIALESQAYFRWNFLRLGRPERQTNIFAQGGIGLLAAYRGADVTMTRGSVLADFTAGLTIPISDRWFIEPSIRAGYPFIAGASLTAGIRFPLRQQARIEFVEIAAPPPPPVEIVRTTFIAMLEYILFGPDIHVFNVGVDADARGLNELVINAVAQTLRENPDFIVRVEGHANPVDHDYEEIAVLDALSLRRANEVARLLRARGVHDDQIVISAFGGTRVLASDHDHWNINRRVELMVIQHSAD